KVASTKSGFARKIIVDKEMSVKSRSASCLKLSASIAISFCIFFRSTSFFLCSLRFCKFSITAIPVKRDSKSFLSKCCVKTSDLEYDNFSLYTPYYTSRLFTFLLRKLHVLNINSHKKYTVENYYLIHGVF